MKSAVWSSYPLVHPNDRRARTALARLQPEDAEHIRAALRRRSENDVE